MKKAVFGVIALGMALGLAFAVLPAIAESPTPTPTASPTSTVSPTMSPTASPTTSPSPTLTPTNESHWLTTNCIDIPELPACFFPCSGPHWGYYYTFETGASGPISIYWQFKTSTLKFVQMYLYDPSGRSEFPVDEYGLIQIYPPTTGCISMVGSWLDGDREICNIEMSNLAPGTYTVYFYNSGLTQMSFLIPPSRACITYLTSDFQQSENQCYFDPGVIMYMRPMIPRGCNCMGNSCTSLDCFSFVATEGEAVKINWAGYTSNASRQPYDFNLNTTERLNTTISLYDSNNSLVAYKTPTAEEVYASDEARIVATTLLVPGANISGGVYTVKFTNLATRGSPSTDSYATSQFFGDDADTVWYTFNGSITQDCSHFIDDGGNVTILAINEDNGDRTNGWGNISDVNTFSFFCDYVSLNVTSNISGNLTTNTYTYSPRVGDNRSYTGAISVGNGSGLGQPGNVTYHSPAIYGGGYYPYNNSDSYAINVTTRIDASAVELDSGNYSRISSPDGSRMLSVDPRLVGQNNSCLWHVFNVPEGRDATNRSKITKIEVHWEGYQTKAASYYTWFGTDDNRDNDALYLLLWNYGDPTPRYHILDCKQVDAGFTWVKLCEPIPGLTPIPTPTPTCTGISHEYTIDFSSGAGTNQTAWDKLGEPINTSDRGAEANASEYQWINASDSFRWTTSYATIDGDLDTQMYKFTIPTQVNISEIENIMVSWQGYGENYSNHLTKLKIWGNVTGNSAWQVLDDKFGMSSEGWLNGNLTFSGMFTPYEYINESELFVLAETSKHVPPSCPYIYGWDGDSYQLIDVAITASFMKRYESITYDSIAMLTLKEGYYDLMATAQWPHDEYINSLGLWVVEHADGTTVIADGLGNVHTLREPQPVTAGDSYGRDVTGMLSAMGDHAIWESDLSGKDFSNISQLHDWIEIILPDRPDAGIAKLVVDVASTTLSDTELDGFLQYILGSPNLGYVMDRIQNNPTDMEWFDYNVWLSAALRIQSWNGTAWTDLEGNPGIMDMSGYLGRPQVVPIDLSQIEGDRIRLLTPAGMHQFDYVAVDYTPDETVSVIQLEPVEATLYMDTDLNVSVAKDILSQIAATDDDYAYLEQGDYINYRFEALDDPAQGMERSFIVPVGGYYYRLGPVEPEDKMENLGLWEHILYTPYAAPEYFLPKYANPESDPDFQAFRSSKKFIEPPFLVDKTANSLLANYIKIVVTTCTWPIPSPSLTPMASPTPTATPEGKPGDVNGDGVINCLDITQCELCILYPETYPKENYPGWDANEDNEGPNAGDILAVEMRILGTWPPPP